MFKIMYKTEINKLLTKLKPNQKDRILKEVIEFFRKYGNNYDLGENVRQTLRKNLPHSSE
jgi:uncharacterized membrane protein